MSTSPLRLLPLCALMMHTFAAHGAFVNTPLPSNTFISLGGLDWAWASPVGHDVSWFGANSPVDLSTQGAYGWRIPTTTELALAPTAWHFVLSGANVPLNGVDPLSGAYSSGGSPNGPLACATPYFSNVFHHCDFSDGLGAGLGQQWYSSGSAATWADSLLVRPTSPIPEPETYALVLIGLGAIGLVARQRQPR